GRDGEVMQRALRLAHLAAQGGEGSLVGIIAVDVTQEGAQLLEGAAIEAAVMREAVPGACAELLDRPCGLGDADDGYVQEASFDQRLQRRKNLFVGEIARGAEEDQGIRTRRRRHECFSLWPPNPNRIAASTRSAKSASPRDAKRSPMAVERIGAGTLSSMA